jgi:hypothetical protein
MATAAKILIRLTKTGLKTSTVVDATYEFNLKGFYIQDLSGYDNAVVQIVTPSAAINFKTTNDDGSVSGVLPPSPKVPANWLTVLGVNLTTKTDVSSLSASGIVKFDIIGNYLQLI